MKLRFYKSGLRWLCQAWICAGVPFYPFSLLLLAKKEKRYIAPGPESTVIDIFIPKLRKNKEMSSWYKDTRVRYRKVSVLCRTMVSPSASPCIVVPLRGLSLSFPRFFLPLFLFIFRFSFSNWIISHTFYVYAPIHHSTTDNNKTVQKEQYHFVKSWKMVHSKRKKEEKTEWEIKDTWYVIQQRPEFSFHFIIFSFYVPSCFFFAKKGKKKLQVIRWRELRTYLLLDFTGFLLPLPAANYTYTLTTTTFANYLCTYRYPPIMPV